MFFTSPLAGEVAATAAGEGDGATFPINAKKGYPYPLSRHTACVDLPRKGGGEEALDLSSLNKIRIPNPQSRQQLNFFGFHHFGVLGLDVIIA